MYATCTKILSFKEIEAREGKGTGVGTGYYAELNGKEHEPSASWFQVGEYLMDKGYYWENVVDTVETDGEPPFAVGTFKWPISMMFRKKGDTGDGKEYGKATHEMESTATGKATIKKGGVGPFSKEGNAPNSEY